MNFNLKKTAFKPSMKNIALFFYVLFFIACFATALKIYAFLSENVYDIIYPDASMLIADEAPKDTIENFRMQQFEDIISRIEQKTRPKEMKNYKNIFN